MEIQVPATRPRRARGKVPPKGWHAAVLEDAREEGRDAVLRWRFRAPWRRTWRIEQTLDAKGLGGVLVDLGFAGRAVTLDDLVGVTARIRVRTRGDGSSAHVGDVRPL